jgi:hypothetical protein
VSLLALPSYRPGQEGALEQLQIATDVLKLLWEGQGSIRGSDDDARRAGSWRKFRVRA